MAVRKVTFICFAAAAVLASAVAVAARWTSGNPIDVKLVRMEASGVVDEDGTEPWLVTLSVSNRSSGMLTFPKEQPRVQASITTVGPRRNRFPALRTWHLVRPKSFNSGAIQG